MTCIAAVVASDGVWVGSDSCQVSGHDFHPIGYSKVGRVGEFMIGTSGNTRTCNVALHSFEPPKRHPDDDMLRYMVREFADALRKKLGDAGALEKENNVETMHGYFLVATVNRLFVVWSHFGVSESTQEGIAAIGSGGPFALGSLHATTEQTPRDRLEKAMEAAERFNVGVRGPFRIESFAESVTK